MPLLSWDELLYDLDHVVGQQHAHLEVGGAALGVASYAVALPQVTVQLIAAHARQVIAAGAEEQRLKQVARVLKGGRIAGAQALVQAP